MAQSLQSIVPVAQTSTYLRALLCSLIKGGIEDKLEYKQWAVGQAGWDNQQVQSGAVHVFQVLWKLFSGPAAWQGAQVLSQSCHVNLNY